jgi:hypothetical protein
LAVTLLDGRILVLDDAGAGTTTADLYDPVTGGFSEPRSIAGDVLAAARLDDGRVLVLGPTSAAILDPVGWTSQRVGSMEGVADARSTTLLADGRVLIMSTIVEGEPTTWAELFDPDSNAVSVTGDLPDRCRDIGSGVRLADGSVLFVGGWGRQGGTKRGVGCGPFGPIATADLFDPAAGIFTAVGPMTEGRHGAGTALLTDGRVLVTGGVERLSSKSGGPEFLGTAELFDPSIRRFSRTGSMSEPRAGHAAVVLRDGRVLVAGGETQAAEIYE